MSGIRDHKWRVKLSFSILPIVLVLIIFFFLLISNTVVTLTKENMSLSTHNCVDILYSRTENVISELNIYKSVIERNYSKDDAELTDFLTTTYMVNDVYPMGIYIGDNTGFYADASGWVPEDEDWILTERPWYVDGKDSSDFVFGEPYMDSQLKKLCVSASARLDYPGAVRVMTTDIYLDQAQDLVSEIVSESSVDGAFFVTAGNKLIIADSQHGMPGRRIGEGDPIHISVAKMLEDGKMGQHEITCDGVTYYVTIEQMRSTHWYLATYVRKNTVLGDLYRIEFIMLIAAVAVTLILNFVTLFFAGKMSDMQIDAKTDRLTGILNRAGFEEVVMEAIEREPEKGALILLDMDNFKSVNDDLGHPVGDKVLKEYARLLETFFNRKSDVAARIGGDEFAVFIGSDLTEEVLADMLTRFMKTMKEHFRKEYGKYKLSSSMGAVFVRDVDRYFDLYRLADKALYEVKRSGKDRFSIGSGRK